MGREIAELKNSKLPEHRQKGILRERSGRKNPFEDEGDEEGDCGTNIRRNKMGTLVVLVVLAGIVAAVLRTMIRDKKAGKSIQCGGNCTACKGHCQAQAAQKEK
jgi:hypothetical protein